LIKKNTRDYFSSNLIYDGRVQMLVKDVMSKEVVTISESDNLAQLIAKFRTYNYHTLPVIDDEKKVSGIVNSEDIMKVCLPHNPVLEKLLESTHLYDTEEEDILEIDLSEDLGTTVKVSDIMNTHLVTIEEHMTIADARKSMKLHNIQRIPVTKEGILVGFITLFDIIIALFKERKII
jgi:CBS domain-containing protein